MLLAALTAAIQQYCECYETKFVAAVPTFIRSAEQRIFNSIQLPALRDTATLAVDGTDATGGTYILPANFLSPYSLAVVVNNSRTYLLQKDFEYLREAFPDDTVTALPQYYALADSFNQLTLRIRLAPVPTAAVVLELKYYALPDSITTAVGGETWLGDNFDSALLWGSIVEAYIFQKGQAELIQTYELRFQQQLDLLKQLGDGKDRQDTYRTPQVKVAVK